MSTAEFGRRELIKGSLLTLGAAALRGLVSPAPVEASVTPENLPAHIVYIEEGAVEFRGASKVSVVLRKKGDMLLLMSQRIRAMGLDLSVDSTNHPELTQVVGIANEGDKPVTVTYETFDGVYARQDRERTIRLDRDSLIQDITTASLVQISRSRIPGNCVPTGCAATRLVTALAFDQNGTTIFEPLEDRMDAKVK